MMIVLLRELRDLQEASGRKIAGVAKLKRPCPERLDALALTVGGRLPADLIELYDRYDGAAQPETMWDELGYFFGHFHSHSSRSLEVINRASRTREQFPLEDETVFARGRSGLYLNSISVGNQSLLAVNRSVASDVRYPAFDGIEAMLHTYIAALREEVWTFSGDGTSHFDNEGFLRIAQRYNRFPIYWERLASGAVDFQIEALEQGKIRPRMEPRSGCEMLLGSGFKHVVEALL